MRREAGSSSQVGVLEVRGLTMNKVLCKYWHGGTFGTMCENSAKVWCANNNGYYELIGESDE